MNYLTAIVLIALLSAFGILLCKKQGLITYIQVHGNEFFSKMAHCDFCLSFWFAMLFCIVAAIYFLEWKFLLFPVFSTPITRMLI